MVKDNFETETAAFWYKAPEVVDGSVRTEDIQTEVFFPSAQVAEMDGTFTNTQRLIKYHHKAVDPPGDARSDTWFTYHLGKRLKKLYQGSRARDQGLLNLVWDYEPDPEEVEAWRIKDEPSALKIMREINGYMSGNPEEHLPGFAALKDDGSTTCASWIYSGIFPKPGLENLRAASRVPDGGGGGSANLDWGFAWPANRRIIYNRASARPDGTPWSEEKAWVYWDPDKVNKATGQPGMWTGADVPDFAVAKAPDTEADPDGIGLDALSGTDPFILKADGKGWLFAPTGLVDGPFPTHYEPIESPVANALYPSQQNSPVHKAWNVDGNPRAEPQDPAFPYVLTTYRLTEHHLSGVMSRWLPWLAELQPELFVEISPELAGEKGIANTEVVRVITPRAEITAKALVTRRMRPMTVAGKTIHHVGLPWHWGYQGLVTGSVTNDLSLMVGDPNVSIHESKAFVCNVEKGHPEGHGSSKRSRNWKNLRLPTRDERLRPVTLSAGARRQMDSLLASQPETAPWLSVLSVVLEEAAEPGAGTPSPPPPSSRPSTRPAHRSWPGRIRIDARLADRWVRRVLTLAADAGPEAIGLRAAAGDVSLDAQAFFEAAVNADGDRLEALARSLDIDPDALAAVAALAVMPLLQALRRRFGPAVDPRWDEGWCPICGWPHLAEQRGLERARRLRCARCGGDWAQPGIRCPYCGVVGHEARAALVSEQDGEARKVETCSACRGYLKSVSTLHAWAGDEVALTDLATVDLDLVALERAFERPSRKG